MRYLLTLPIILYTIGDTFKLSLGIGPGLSLKNAAVALVGLMLALRMVVRGGYRLELPAIHFCFAILIAYAVCSMLVAGLIIRYEGYHVLDSAVNLKTTLIDQALILALFFYGTRTIKDGVFLTKVLVAAVTVANIICIASIEGHLDIEGVSATPEEGGRVSGPFGHPNGTAALIAAVIPAYVAIARSSGGAWPLVWIAGSTSAVAMLFMTASRGAFLGMLIGYPWAAYTFRRYLSSRQILLWTGASIVLGAVVLSLVGTQFVALFLERVVTESTASDVGALSSGRSDIWVRALEKMITTPITLITGFGWDAYDSMALHYGVHNQYFNFWFELGLVGLCSFVTLLLRTLFTVRSAVDGAAPASRGYLMAFVFGFVAFSITLFFGQMFLPWVYVWAYAGMSLRMALLAVKADTSASVSSLGGEEKRRASLRNQNGIVGKSRVVKTPTGARSESSR
jgi:O-antigen ligase